MSNAEQLGELEDQAARLCAWLSRDLAGWAPAGMDMAKLRRVYAKAEQRLERRHAKMIDRLRRAHTAALLERTGQ